MKDTSPKRKDRETANKPDEKIQSAQEKRLAEEHRAAMHDANVWIKTLLWISGVIFLLGIGTALSILI